MASAPAGALGEFLVVGFGFIEFARRCDLGHDWLFARSLRDIAHFFSDVLLLVIEVKNRRAVLVANVWALAVELRGVVHSEKLFDERFVADFFGVEFDKRCFGVPG